MRSAHIGYVVHRRHRLVQYHAVRNRPPWNDAARLLYQASSCIMFLIRRDALSSYYDGNQLSYPPVLRLIARKMAANTTEDANIDPRCIAEQYDDPDVTGALVSDVA